MRIPSDHAPRTCTTLELLGFHLANPEEIARGREAAAELVGGGIAQTETLLRVQARTQCSSFVAVGSSGRLVAAVSSLPLTSRALVALHAGEFDAIDPPDAMIARAGDPVAALYLWGAAGLTWRGRTLALAACVALQCDVHPTLPVYARGASRDGERALHTRIGAKPAQGGLVVAPPRYSQITAA